MFAGSLSKSIYGTILFEIFVCVLSSTVMEIVSLSDSTLLISPLYIKAQFLSKKSSGSVTSTLG